MAKPRIIIADTNEKIVFALQLQMARELFENVDLEIITDKDYCSALFATPQIAEALIVSEELYDPSMNKHDISNIFLMTEEQFDGESHTEELNINYIYKYTDTKAIFNQVYSRIGYAFSGEKSKGKETKVVLFCSASGGTGKTTLSLAVSHYLAKSYNKVLYINAEHMQYFQHKLKNTSPISNSDVYASLSGESKDIYADVKHVIRSEDFNYLPPFKAPLVSLGIDFNIFKKIVVSAKKSTEYDYIIIDTNSNFDEDKLELLNIADRVIVVINQSFSSVVSTNTFVANISGVNDNKYLFVCNNFDEDKENALISPAVSKKFTIGSDYIDTVDHFDRMEIGDISKISSVRKLANWLM